MSQKRVMAINDISCFGKCSLTVALPLISAAGAEVCPVPTAILSTHTGGFEGYTFKDLSEQIMPITEHWKKLGLEFDCIYSGYLGSYEQLTYVSKIIDMYKTEIVLVDPVMADLGKLYKGFDSKYVEGMKKLCSKADIIVPNITESCFMTGVEYKKPPYERKYIEELLNKTSKIGAKITVLTGVSFEDGIIGAATYDNGDICYHFSDKTEEMYHGTGDVFASTLLCGLLKGFSVDDACSLAVEFVPKCINNTKRLCNDVHYGVNFESCIGWLTEALKGEKR